AAAHADPDAASPAAHGVEAPIEAVPWSQVGPGWTLALWSPAPGHGAGEAPPDTPTPRDVSTTLYLVDPAGGRYAITPFRPSSDGPPQVIDWSGDGGRALIDAHRPASSAALIEVDLHTGTQTTLDVDGRPQYTRPNGKAVLLATGSYDSVPGSLVRADL